MSESDSRCSRRHARSTAGRAGRSRRRRATRGARAGPAGGAAPGVLASGEVRRALRGRREGPSAMSDYPFFFTWTAQNAAKPFELTGGEGAWFTHHRRRALARSRRARYQVNVGHGNKRIVEAIKRQADELCLSAPNAVYPGQGRAREAPARDGRPGLLEGVLHARRRRGQRERAQDRAPRHRPAQAHRALPQLSRRVDGRALAHRRLAPSAARAAASPASSTSRTATAIAVRSASASTTCKRECATNIGDDDAARGAALGRRRVPRAGARRERRARAAARVLAARARGVRRRRRAARRRRGAHRLRPHRQAVRLPALGRRRPT